MVGYARLWLVVGGYGWLWVVVMLVGEKKGITQIKMPFVAVFRRLWRGFRVGRYNHTRQQQNRLYGQFFPSRSTDGERGEKTPTDWGWGCFVVCSFGL